MLKKKLTLGNIMGLTAALFALIAFFMMFAPAIAAKKVGNYDTGISYSGWNVAFGASNDTGRVLNFAFGNFLTFLLVIAGIVLIVLHFLEKGGKLTPFIAGGVLVLAGILFFCALPMTSPNVGNLTGELADKAVEAFKDSYTLGAGAVAGGIFSLLSGGLLIVKGVLKK